MICVQSSQYNTIQYNAIQYSFRDICNFLFSVSEGRVMGILEVSRSIGDGRFKRCGVIPTPDVFKCTLTEQDL